MEYQYLIKKPATVEKQGGGQARPFQDNRPESITQKKLIESIHRSSNVSQCQLSIAGIRYESLLGVIQAHPIWIWDNRWNNYIDAMINAKEQISFTYFRDLVSTIRERILTRYRRMLRVETGYWNECWNDHLEEILLNLNHEVSGKELLELLTYGSKPYDQSYPPKNLEKKLVGFDGKIHGQLSQEVFIAYCNYKKALEMRSSNIEALRILYCSLLSKDESEFLKQSYEAASEVHMKNQKDRRLYNNAVGYGYLYHGVPSQATAYTIQESGYLQPARSKFRGYSDSSMDGLLSFALSFSGALPGIIFRVRATSANILKWEMKKVSVDEVRTVFPIPVGDLEWTNDCVEWTLVQDRPIPSPNIRRIDLYTPATSKKKKG